MHTIQTGNPTLFISYIYNPEFFIFRSLCFFKSQKTYTLNKNNRPLSYTRAREILLKALDDIGFDKSRFGLYSLRSGGASTAANKGVSERLLKAHGRWSSIMLYKSIINPHIRKISMKDFIDTIDMNPVKFSISVIILFEVHFKLFIIFTSRFHVRVVISDYTMPN
jgi:hypothetical protein